MIYMSYFLRCHRYNFILLTQIATLFYLSFLSCSLNAATLTFPQYPLSIGQSTNPNMLILYDNSDSMDHELNPSYFYIGGNDPQSRSNIARNTLRSIINQYSSKINIGLETFELTGDANYCADSTNGRCGIYTGYQGDSSTMVFTNDCTNGKSPSNGGLGCIPNPEPNNGYNYITHSLGEVGNSAYLVASYYKNWVWGTYAAGDTSGLYIDIFDHHNSVTSWNISNDNSTAFDYNNDFSNTTQGVNPHYWNGCIDYGDVNCVQKKLPRLLWINTGWAYFNTFSGKGSIIEATQSISNPSHVPKLINALAPETSTPNSSEIKNGSYQTPLMGSFITASQYFSGTLPSYTSPIQNSCQKNFVVVATDGQPTVDNLGNLYGASDLSDPVSGRAYTDLYPRIQALRSTNYSGNTYDIKTYVLGMGDVVNAPEGVTGLNNMAQNGGTNQAYIANDANTLTFALQDIVNKIQSNMPITQSNGHYAVSYPTPPNLPSVYKTYFSANGNIWQGNLVKSSPIVSFSGGLINYDTGGTPTNYTVGAASWLTNTTVNGQARQIITSSRPNPASSTLKGTAFQWNSLNSSTQNILIDSSETTATGNLRLNYIRGDRTNEASQSSPNGFRTRGSTILGDIIDSSPIYVGLAASGYSNSDFSSATPSYSTFSQVTFARKPMIYVGANDGMLHGFDANTLQEIFAYIPNSVLSKFINFSKQSYTHDFFVDETPVVADIPVGGTWVTQLIGFPGMGGTGLFALDITSPGSMRPATDLTKAEANAQNIVLWELNSQTDHDIGYILNRGDVNQIRGRTSGSGQTGKLSNGRWAIITGNGYNSPNNSTGLLISYLDAKGGTPSYKKIMIPGINGGLSTPSLVDVDYDGIIDYAYAGDLYGNVWRFDLRGSESTWSVFRIFAPKIATPITTAPAIIRHCSKKGIIVIVGTGKYIESTDNNPGNSDGHPDYLIGLWDKFDSVTISMSNLAQQQYSADTNGFIVSSDNTVNWSTQRGWYIQLFNNPPTPARIVVPPYIGNGMVYFNTITPIPAAQSCISGTLSETTQALNACTGGRPTNSAFDINSDGKIDNSDQITLKGKSINVTGVNLSSTQRVVDSSVWITPKQFTCSTPPCVFDTGLSDSVSVNLFLTPPERRSWKQLGR